MVLARGTGRDNRTTAWSVEAIERYTSISRSKAATALRNLQAAGYCLVMRSGTKPKYELKSFGDLPEADRRPPLDSYLKWIFERLGKGGRVAKRDRKVGALLVQSGWLTEQPDGTFAIAPPPQIALDLIWLPNELVTGTGDELPPIELVRQMQDVMTLRLLIDLYHAQNLREDGGVPRHSMRLIYDRQQIGEQAQFVVWGFRPKHEGVWRDGLTQPHHREKLTAEEKKAGRNAGVDWFRRTAQLHNVGLFEWMPYLVESADKSGEIIHPVGLAGFEGIEDRLGRAANDAGRAMVTEGQRNWASENGFTLLVPVPRHIENVQVVGIARLRYRPHTAMTAAWWAQLNENAEKHLAHYAALTRENTRRAV